MFLDFVQALITLESDHGPPVLHLFGGPYITHQRRRVDIPEGSKRLLAFVALHRGWVERSYAAGALWPTGDDTRAAGNLRSALWRLNRTGVDLMSVDKHRLAIDEGVLVDVQLIGSWASRMITDVARDADLEVMPSGVDALDLLPGWCEDWALLERERVRQRLLHALEALSRRLSDMGRSAEAVEAALLAVAAEPLRESAQRALIAAHLAEGNWVEGCRAFQAYRRLLEDELGTSPGPEISAMLHPSVRQEARASLRAMASPRT